MSRKPQFDALSLRLVLGIDSASSRCDLDFVSIVSIVLLFSTLLLVPIIVSCDSYARNPSHPTVYTRKSSLSYVWNFVIHFSYKDMSDHPFVESFHDISAAYDPTSK